MVWGVEQMTEHVYGCGLAVRTRDAEQSEVAHGPVERGRGHDRRGVPSVLHDDGGECCAPGIFDDGGCGACGAGFVQEIVTITLASANREKERARGHAAAIVFDRRHVGGKIPASRNKEVRG